MSKERELAELLMAMFTTSELRRWVAELPDGEIIARELPGEPASEANVTSEAVRLIAGHRGMDAELFQRLLDARPRRGDEIRKVAASFGVQGLRDGSIANEVVTRTPPWGWVAAGAILLAVAAATFALVRGREQGLSASVEACGPDGIRLSVINPDDQAYLLTQRDFALIVAGVRDDSEKVQLRFEPTGAIEPGTRSVVLKNALSAPMPFEPDGRYRVVLAYTGAAGAKAGELSIECGIIAQ